MLHTIICTLTNYNGIKLFIKRVFHQEKKKEIKYERIGVVKRINHKWNKLIDNE